MAEKTPHPGQREQDCQRDCDPKGPQGPPREAGGTTGAGNMSPGQASRTGGATSGVAPTPPQPPPIPPDA